jgi:hypothetical protein
MSRHLGFRRVAVLPLVGATVRMVLPVVGVLALIRATMDARTHHVTVQVDDQTGLAVQINALDQAGFQ